VGNTADEAFIPAARFGEGNLSLGLKKWELNMRITITIEDTDDGQVDVSEARVASDGETEESVTSATALADAMFEVMDQLGEVEGTGWQLIHGALVAHSVANNGRKAQQTAIERGK
jgi:hypothetical protein